MPLNRVLIFFVFIFIKITVYAQTDKDYSSLFVPKELKQKANAVVRFDKQTIEIEAFDEILVTTKRIVTVYNEYGITHHNAYEGYDQNTKIKSIGAIIYDASGEEIKKIKEKDFTDRSAVSGGTLYSDNRVKYLDYTPVNYPYTIEYTSEVQMKSTAFIPKWRPIDGYYVAVEYSEFQIINNSDIKLRTKAENFEGYNIEVLSESFVKAKNLKAINYEAYNPGLLNIVPTLKSALTTFNMEGVKGENNNWNDFGKWMYDELLTGTEVIPQSVIEEVRLLTSGVADNMEKAKLVYKYMQDKTRYISVQVGIGGWKPMNAIDVDKLGYADCKGLTNYTKSLLEAVGVPSYYTVVWGDEDIKNIDKDFSVTEGNHVILCVPNDNDNIFLECTSQTNPFGFTAGFTDDRDVLLVKPEGGVIVHTRVYEADDSRQLTKAKINIDASGNFVADVAITSSGFQYNIHEAIVDKTKREQELYYKQYWANINNISLTSFDLDNNTDEIVLTEKVSLSAENYASKSGNRLIFKPNVFNTEKSLPSNYKTRNLDFKLQRAFKDVDEIIIQLPLGFKVEAMAEGDSIETKFGKYKFDIEEIEGNKLKYTREYVMYKGDFTKDDYYNFRNFKKEIIKLDKIKIVLIQNP